ncbi:MAG: acyltransferase [Pseudomonadota bacterium]
MFGPGWARFILAWMVVVEHVSRFQIGKVAVMAFFMLSGYWVTRVFIERYSDGVQGVLTFYLARFLRIWPLYAAVFLMVLLVAVFLPLHLPSDFWWAVPIFGVASHDLDIIGVTWSLDIELQFYLLLPLIVFFMRGFPQSTTKGLLLVILGLLWAVGIFLGWRFGVETALVYLPLFLAGAAVYLYDITPSGTAARLSLGFFILAGFVVAAIPVLRPFVIYGHETHFPDLLFSMAWGLLLVPFIAVNVRQHSSLTDRHLGNMSYVIYLVHFPIIKIAGEILGRDMTDAEKIPFFVVVLLVSWLIYILLDVHFERWRKVIVNALPHARAVTKSRR